MGWSGMPRGRRLPSAGGAVVLAALLLVAGPVGVARGAPLSGVSADAATWAYGGISQVNFSGVSTTGVPYVGNVTAGFTVQILQTNLTGGEVALNVSRTSGVAFAIEYCNPNCQRPLYHASLSARLWESDRTEAELRTNGSVAESGGSIPAVALIGSTTSARANETESASSYLPVAGSLPVARSSYLSAAIASNTSVAFAQPLGLFPINLSAAQSWSSSAAFSATGNGSYAYSVARSGPVEAGVSGSGPLPSVANGTEVVQGSSSPSDLIHLGGVSFPEIGLAASGPLGMVDGVVLLPTAAQLLQSATARPWSGNESGTASAAMSYLDARATYGGHFGVEGSRWFYGLQTIEPTATLSLAGAPVTDLAGSGTPDAPARAYVQGEPQTSAASAATQGCLLAGSGCPSAAPMVPSALHGLLGLGLLGAALGAVLVAAVFVGARRRVPPPVYPNAALYPPGGSTGNPEPRGPDPAPDPDAQDDPLGHLW